jgi:hypothetical protein
VADSCHIHSLSPLLASDQVQGAGYSEFEVETDMTALQLEIFAAALELETSMAALELEIDIAALELETNVAALKLKIEAAALDLEMETDAP